MGGEGMTKGVRVHAGLRRCVPCPDAQAPSHIARGQAFAALREEERGLGVGAGQRGTSTFQIGRNAAQRRLTSGHEPRLSTLSLDTDLLFVEVDAVDIEIDELFRAQAARVGQLEERTVALLEWR